ncbi:MAG: hypothetical protein HGA84_01595 [Syntrophobacteraceae bacterium]|nr:hypothetical protein [Syntrophobacteraceae bacterium]
MQDESTGANIEWSRLSREFDDFDTPAEECRWSCGAFVQSLVEPVPPFVEWFIERKIRNGMGRGEAVRALYCFLLEKRYKERLNLLHFAFNVFDDESCLPKEIVDRTPFPHEDGTPRYRHFNDPAFLFPSRIQKVPSD